MKKLLFVFLLIFSISAFADGQDGNGTGGGQLSRLEKKFCESIGISIFTMDEIRVDISSAEERSILDKEDIIEKCCKLNPYNPACKK